MLKMFTLHVTFLSLLVGVIADQSTRYRSILQVSLSAITNLRPDDLRLMFLLLGDLQ